MSTEIKYAVIIGFLGQHKDRFQVFGPPYTVEDKIKRAAQVDHCGAIEAVYPHELGDVQAV
ncbi:MAG: hypothetical protein GYB65_06150 [Chloroflexi bacterium]|nr:hypothetical protein [Chloroflexota bacterium]